jgi:uncharacterized protein (DUF885 family)
MFRLKSVFLALFVLSAVVLPAIAASPAWVERSNENARILLDVMARFSPESAGQLGVDGYDEAIIDLQPGVQERSREAVRKAIDQLRLRRVGEHDPPVLQDLEILLKAAEDNIRGDELYSAYQLPYFNLSRIVFSGIRALLDDQIPAERRNAALVRLKRYAGMIEGETPVATLARDRISEKLSDKSLTGPVKAEVEKDLSDMDFFLNGIASLFDKYQIDGYQEAHAALREQMKGYADFIRNEVMPRATDDFRLPPELYAYNLEQFGVEMPPELLAQKARMAFADIQKQMQEIAVDVAKEHGMTVADYRDVIRELKKDQLVGDAILPLYEERIKDLEEIIAREDLVSLPDRKMAIRLASEAESAAIPAPNMRPPRLVGNTGEIGEFVLPLRVPGKEGSEEEKLDDFTFVAASWTLTAHEGRPGHELQFTSMVEKGVSTARMIFAFNSVNVEGWGLYSEAIVFPYLPAEGKLIALQHRLLRAGRAFMDPELQLGKITMEEADRILREEVVLSGAMATQEVERYTFRAPGQATSYFYGFIRLMDLRAEVGNILGSKFNQREFHDFILSQGLLPPELMRSAVFAHFGITGKKM